jgi:hypothetical protein
MGNDVLKNTLEGCILIEKSGSSSSAMALLDFKKENTIKYKVDTSDTDATSRKDRLC